ncbi:MAG TPA: hypothetical protein DCL77_07835, partial [Prolixibacteraceae bacterium]|nr:hypothetical protein [Prolixibacteraceae bacterium]
MTIKKHFRRNIQKFTSMKQFIFLFCLTVVLFSCTRNPLKINVSNVPLDLKIKHLDLDLLKVKPEEMPVAIPLLKASYKEFFDIFTYKMIAIGGSEQENFPQLLSSFVSDTLITNLKTA